MQSHWIALSCAAFSLFCSSPLHSKDGPTQTHIPPVGVKDAKRLSLLNQIYNPSSIAFLKKMGISEGMTVLDLGCGSGIMSCELSMLVGPTGRVICVDNSDEQLEIAEARAICKGLTNLEFIKLRASDLAHLEAQVDAVYCRFFLMHLKHPELALKNVFQLLKPHGKLFVEEPTGLDTIKCYPMTESFAGFLDLGYQQFQIYHTDPAIGSKLAGQLHDLGFSTVSSQLFHPILQTPDERSMIRLSAEALSFAFVEKQLLSKESMQAICQGLKVVENDPMYFVTYLQVAQICAEK